MRTLILMAALGLAVASSNPVEAAVGKKPVSRNKQKVAVAKTKTVKKAKPTRAKLQTDIVFDDSVVYGEYQSPDDMLAKVENEKRLSDLLGVRKHFKDRLPEAAEQE